jgi:uncharacterized damage-inducible protein DinB
MAAVTPWHLHFAQLARYNVWATQRLLTALGQPAPNLDRVALLQQTA